MNGSRILRLLGTIAIIIVVNIVVFSPGLLGVELGGGDRLQTAVGATLIIVSLLVLLYQSYTLLFRPPVIQWRTVGNEADPEEYSAALGQYKSVKVLKKDMALATDQIERMQKKKRALMEVLGQRFEPTELSYTKFTSVILEVERLFYLNLKGILNKLSVFDPSEFAQFAGEQGAARFSERLVQERKSLYNKYLAYIEGYLAGNEEIMLKLDKLLLEISLLGSTDYREIDEMPCMKEIDALIQQTKYYKH
ncbi:hypothetical protein [Paenibacillus sp. SYP-B4298]|uniref:hypothetical protein n=1 Tax=Paenibacillus sp. SYP-B4298 TaxID=2996034 RepID=UPI0022DD6B33|nr:hypothetical protein [Paenibacillus sp. SYP-B4298]